jgi:hypothetical protein
MLEGMDRGELGDFLRSRRALLQPSDIGMPVGPRPRTPGLRRFEVAQLAGMSPDYLARLEQGRGAAPSVALVDRPCCTGATSRRVAIDATVQPDRGASRMGR